MRGSILLSINMKQMSVLERVRFHGYFVKERIRVASDINTSQTAILSIWDQESYIQTLYTKKKYVQFGVVKAYRMYRLWRYITSHHPASMFKLLGRMAKYLRHAAHLTQIYLLVPGPFHLLQLMPMARNIQSRILSK